MKITADECELEVFYPSSGKAGIAVSDPCTSSAIYLSPEQVELLISELTQYLSER